MHAKDTTVSDSQSKTPRPGGGRGDRRRRRRAPPRTSRSPSCSRCATATLCVLLWQRARAPFSGAWSLPGGYLGPGDTLERSIRAHLARKVDVAELSWLEQLETLSDPGRHPASGSSRRPTSGSSRSASTRRCPEDTAWHPVERASRARLRPRGDRARRPRAPAGQAVLHEHRLRARARVVLDLRAVRHLHRRARLSGRPDQPAPRARAPRRARGHRRAPRPRARGGRPAAVYRFARASSR